MLFLYRTEMDLFIFHGLTTDYSLYSEQKMWSHSQGGNNMIQYYEDTHMLPDRSQRVHMQQPRTLSFSGLTLEERPWQPGNTCSSAPLLWGAVVVCIQIYFCDSVSERHLPLSEAVVVVEFLCKYIFCVQFLPSPVVGGGQSCSQACCKHCLAVARLSGSSSNMVNRKSLN